MGNSISNNFEKSDLLWYAVAWAAITSMYSYATKWLHERYGLDTNGRKFFLHALLGFVAIFIYKHYA